MKGRIGWKELCSTSGERGRVLVVDDELEVRRSLQRLITKFGHYVRATASAEEADKWIAAERFDVCLLDIDLPGMKGVEFLSWALRVDPEMAVIMLTGLDSPAVAIDCIDRGARAYLVKPIDAGFLRRTLRDAVAMRRILVERNDLASGS